MPRRYFVFTLGCQMNISDSQRIANKLESLGFKSASEKGADLIIANACSVRQKAVDRLWGKIKKWQKEDKKIFITGCLLPKDKRKLLKKGLEIFLIKDLPYIIKKSKDVKEYFKIAPNMTGEIALIPIMTGCDNFCSYCAVPFTRGREISRPLKDIISEIKNALKKGYKKILLLGQNVNSYGIKKSRDRSTFLQDNYGDNSEFIKLLKDIDKMPYDFQFNFLSSNPLDMSNELIECFSNLKKWPRELHLPLQSGDDEILRRMNRKYTSAQYLNLVKILQEAIGDLKISTDIIVGFPGETNKQFENTLSLCKKIKFQKAYIAQYSPRSGTAADKFEDDVPQKEKKHRWLILERLINQKKS